MLTNEYINCNLRLMNGKLTPLEKGGIVNDELRSPAFAELRRGKPALTQAAVATVEPRCAENAAAKAEKKAVKTVKSLFAIFQSEPAAAQSVPTKTGRGDFTAFALILRMGMGEGVNYEN